jgi:P27 family predicted phage terminase small subunit
MRGRKPKPTARQIAEGDPRRHGKKKLQEQLAKEPKAARGLPDCPDHVADPLAHQIWDFWREELAAMKLDSRPDAVMLEGACVNYARAVQADLILARHGLVVAQPIVNAKGKQIGLKMKNHPALAASNAAWKQVRAFCSEFGLSPVSRTRLTLEKPDTSTDELMALLTKPREKKSSVPPGTVIQ